MPSTPHAHITAEPGSRLERLHADYADAKAEADAADERLKACVAALKFEMTQAAPDATSIRLTGTAPPLRLLWAESWRLDTKKLKANEPSLYVRYATKVGTWVLRADKRAMAE